MFSLAFLNRNEEEEDKGAIVGETFEEGLRLHEDSDHAN